MASTVDRLCPTCGRRFAARVADVNRGKSKYCSRPCVPRMHSAEARAKISKARKGMTFSDAHKANLRKAWETREPVSDETRAKIGAAHRGKKRPPEVVAKIAAAHKGKTLTAEHRENLRTSHVGNRPTPETRAKMSAARKANPTTPEALAKTHATRKAKGNYLKGADHPAWKGGMSLVKYRYYDPRYTVWRNAVLERDHYTCQTCGKVFGKNDKGLDAHHIKAYKTHPEHRHDVSNGRALCRACHRALHGLTPIEREPRVIPCACGCGTLRDERDTQGRVRRYVRGHGPRLAHRKAASPK